MKSKILTLLLSTHLLFSAAYGAGEPLIGQEASDNIFVNNRILVQVNDRPISVIDVMKKMDMLFYKQYPQYTNSAPARFQFYQLHWKQVLQDLVDKELVLADAAEAKVVVSNGDIRQAMEEQFGPNIVVNLDKVGLSFDEAWKMVESDLIIRQMIAFRISSQAFKKATPQNIRLAYEEFAKKNTRPEQWVYTVISVRDPDPDQGADVAKMAHEYLAEQSQPLEQLSEKLASLSATAKVTISEKFRHVEKELSPAYKEALLLLTPGTFSQPIAQKSRDKSTVYRIFYLQEHTAEGAIPFNEVESKLRIQLFDEAASKETQAYLNRLRKHYHVDERHKEMTSDDFAPFVLSK